MAQPMVAAVTLDALPGPTFYIRYVSPRRRDEIVRLSQVRKPGDVFDTTDPDKFSALWAKELFDGWESLTPLDALELGYPDWESLKTDEQGCVLFNEKTALELYRGCDRVAFRNVLEERSMAIASEVARAKKREAASSATSPAPLG